MSTGFARSGPGAGARPLRWWYISMISSIVTLYLSGFLGILPLKAASSVGDSGVIPIRCRIGSFMPGDAHEIRFLVAPELICLGRLSTAMIRFCALLAMQAPRAPQSAMHLAERFSSKWLPYLGRQPV